jgi:hypothetical protein
MHKHQGGYICAFCDPISRSLCPQKNKDEQKEMEEALIHIVFLMLSLIFAFFFAPCDDSAFLLNWILPFSPVISFALLSQYFRQRNVRRERIEQVRRERRKLAMEYSRREGSGWHIVLYPF